MDQVETAGTGQDERGFTVIEMVVALTIMAFALMAMASVQYSSLKALGASRQRSAFVEIGNAVMEQMRAMPATSVGVDAADPNLATAYGPAPSYPYKGLPAVVLPAGSGAPAALETVTTSPVKGITSYKVHRWVTRDPSSANDDLRRLEVRVDWSENTRVARSVTLTSVWYPGGLGTDPPANNVPVVSSATVTPPGGPVTTIFTFKAVATDPDADGLSFSWQFGDGSVGSGSTTTHSFAASGIYSALVTVKDTRGGQATQSVNVPVGSAYNSAPVAQFDLLSGDNGPAPFTVNASAAGSSDPDGDTLTYLWNWGDGTTGTGVNAGHVYNATGSYPITVTVTDPSGATSTSASKNVNVSGGCAITSARFKNPGTNASANDIKVVNTNNTKPANSEFVFTATTNLYCSSVTWSLQTTNQNQRYEVTATSATTSGVLKTWTFTGSIPNSHQFPLGALLTGFATSSGATYSFTFNAHV